MRLLYGGILEGENFYEWSRAISDKMFLVNNTRRNFLQMIINL